VQAVRLSETRKPLATRDSNIPGTRPVLTSPSVESFLRPCASPLVEPFSQTQSAACYDACITENMPHDS